MEPRIQYARTTDGVSIALATHGEGPPLVLVPPAPFSHLQLEWAIPEHRYLYEQLSGAHQLVRYDGRGSGLSSRGTPDRSLAAQLRDLDAVVRRLHLAPCALFAPFHAGAVAIAYAADQPARVSHLVLWSAAVRGSDYLRMRDLPGLLAVLEHDWELFTEATAHAWLGWSEGIPARRVAALLRAATSPTDVRAWIDALGGLDVAGLLPRVQAPTLVLHRPGYAAALMDWARELAAGIPTAELRLVSGASGSPFLDDVDAVVRAISEFIATPDPAPSPPDRPPSGLTEREAEVLRRLAHGQTNKEMARDLVISPHTVERHVANIYRKIGAGGRADATAYALTHDLVSPPFPLP